MFETTLSIRNLSVLATKAAGKPVSRSADKLAAIARLNKFLAEVLNKADVTSELKAILSAGNLAEAESVLAAIMNPPKEKARKGAGRKSSFQGQKLFPLAQENPRRKGSFGWRSFEVLRQKPGIEYAEFLADGGRRVDLAWDIKHGYVTAKM